MVLFGLLLICGSACARASPRHCRGCVVAIMIIAIAAGVVAVAAGVAPGRGGGGGVAGGRSWSPRLRPFPWPTHGLPSFSFHGFGRLRNHC